MGKIHQIYTTLSASYGMLLCGLMLVWPSYTTSLYTDRNTTLLSAPMTDVHVSLMGSLLPLGSMLGTIIMGKIINALGRKKGGLILILPFLLSWIMVDVTNSSIVVLLARFIGGIPSGAFIAYGPVFVSEVAEKSIRGLLASGPIVLHCLGLLVSYLFGWFLPYRHIIWANMFFSSIGILMLMMVTESPVWLVRQKGVADARLAVAYYMGVSPESDIVRDEIMRLNAQFFPAVELTSIPVTSPSTLHAFIVTGLTVTLQVMMGLMIVQVYAKEFFSKAIPTISPYLCSVLLAATLLFGTATSAVFSDRFGRRILLIVSAGIVVICLVCMGVFMQNNVVPPWVMGILVLVYCYAFKLGAGNVPYILLAEVFVPEVQSTVAIILIEWMWLFSFIHLGIFPFIVKYLGIHGAFCFFAVFGVLDVLVGIFLLPETKGLTRYKERF